MYVYVPKVISNFVILKQLNLSEFARVCNLSRTTVYKYLGLLEG